MSFTPRTSIIIPTNLEYVNEVTEANKWWYSSEYNNGAKASLCLPNCTTYARGRVCEIANKNVTPLKGYTTNFPNAYYWFGKSNWETGQVPKVGAIGCFATANESIGGHVVVVEKTDGTLDGTYISYSGYVNATNRSFTNPGKSSAYYFRYETITDMINRYKSIGANYELTLQGFMYNPYVDDLIVPLVEPTTRNTRVNQLKALANIYVHTEPNLASPYTGEEQHMCTKDAIYDVLDSYEGENYVWYKLAEQNWLPTLSDWIEYYPASTDYIPIVDAVEENKNINQVYINVGNLRVRVAPSTTADIAGYNTHYVAQYGYYNVLDITSDDTYRWYKIGDNNWIANPLNSGDWLTYIEATIIVPITNPVERDDKVNQIKININNLRVRVGPGTEYGLAGDNTHYVVEGAYYNVLDIMEVND